MYLSLQVLLNPRKRRVRNPFWSLPVAVPYPVGAELSSGSVREIRKNAKKVRNHATNLRNRAKR